MRQARVSRLGAGRMRRAREWRKGSRGGGGGAMEALAVTAQLCGPELERYGRCVAASPGSWHRDCHQLSLSVTECASNHPLVRRIRRDCSDSFGAFERCLRERPRSTAECGPHVSQFLLCAQNVTQSATPSATPGDSPSASPRGTSTENPWN